MIYATTTDGGVLIGLSARNIVLLMQGNPIFKELPGMPKLVVMFGETEQEIFDLLKKHGLLPAADAEGVKT